MGFFSRTLFPWGGQRSMVKDHTSALFNFRTLPLGRLFLVFLSSFIFQMSFKIKTNFDIFKISYIIVAMMIRNLKLFFLLLTYH